MKWRRIEKGDKQYLCAACHRNVKPGQVMVTHTLGPQHPITDRFVRWHAKCLDDFMAEVPTDTDKQAFNDLRDRIAATGRAFPD